jgi:multidrug efflux pump
VEPVKAMLITAAQRVRPVLLTATVTALGVIPMALNIEFDFIRREIVTGGLAGGWFTHLSAALVSGLFVSTALTLVMVPVMITAPSVIRKGWIGKGVGAVFGFITAPFRKLFGGKHVAVTPDGQTVEVPAEIPADVDSSKRFIKTEGSGLVETEQDGVTVITRQAAE